MVRTIDHQPLLAMNLPVHVPAELSTHIKSLRKARGLSQAQLGALMGVGQVRIADIEKNPGVVSIEQLMRLLRILDTCIVLQPGTIVSADGAPGRCEKSEP